MEPQVWPHAPSGAQPDEVPPAIFSSTYRGQRVPPFAGDSLKTTVALYASSKLETISIVRLRVHIGQPLGLHCILTRQLLSLLLLARLARRRHLCTRSPSVLIHHVIISHCL